MDGVRRSANYAIFFIAATKSSTISYSLTFIHPALSFEVIYKRKKS